MPIINCYNLIIMTLMLPAKNRRRYVGRSATRVCQSNINVQKRHLMDLYEAKSSVVVGENISHMHMCWHLIFILNVFVALEYFIVFICFVF